jgi:hypothetical protein
MPLASVEPMIRSLQLLWVASFAVNHWLVIYFFLMVRNF